MVGDAGARRGRRRRDAEGAADRVVRTAAADRPRAHGAGRGVAQRIAMGGAWWQSAPSCGAAGVVVRAPLLLTTASCFIAPDAGDRFASIGPTNPTGADAAWQSRQLAGCVVTEACSRPGKKVPEAAPA